MNRSITHRGGGAAPRVPVAFARASISPPSLHSSSAQFISPECPSYNINTALYPKSQSPVAKRKERFFGGDLKRGLNSRSAVWCKQEKGGVKLEWERRQWMDPEKGHRWGKVDEVGHVGKREQRTEPIQAPPHCIKQLPAFALQFLEAQLKSCCPGVGTMEYHSQGFRNQRILGWLLIITTKTHKCWGWVDSTNNNSFFPPEFRIDWKRVSGIRQMKIYQSSDVITNKGQAGDCILIRLDQLA